MKHIFLLGAGALEHYLPSYVGDRYSLNDAAKKNAVAAEVVLLASGAVDSSLAERYGELFRCIQELPSKPPVDTDSVLRGYVGNYIHDLQGLVVSKPDWGQEQITGYFQTSPTALGRLVTLLEFERFKMGEFRAVLKITGSQGLLVDVTHETNAGMRRFEFKSPAANKENAALS